MQYLGRSFICCGAKLKWLQDRNALNQSWSFKRNAQGQLTQAIDPLGNATSYA